MQRISFIAKLYIAAVALAGIAVLAGELARWQWNKPVEFLALLGMTLVASRLRIKLPGMNGVMSVNLPFLLIVAIRLGGSGSFVVAALAGLVQSIPTAGKRTTPVQVLFNSATIANAVAAASFLFGFAAHHGLVLPLSVAAAGITFFVANTLPIALVLWLAEGQSAWKMWKAMARLSAPYYTLSAGIAAIVCEATQFAVWAESLALLPLMYSIYTSFRAYFAVSAPATTLLPDAAAMAAATAEVGASSARIQ